MRMPHHTPVDREQLDLPAKQDLETHNLKKRVLPMMIVHIAR
jgi:hypothetical protein